MTRENFTVFFLYYVFFPFLNCVNSPPFPFFFPENVESVKLTLDNAQAEFLTPETAVISLKGGELYVLSLLLDGMRSVRGFHLDRAASSVLTTCLSVVDQRYLFLGSREGGRVIY